MIEGLIIKKVVEHHDARGFLAELAKEGEPTFREVKQTSYSEINPGVIKAFHAHRWWEIWCVVKGTACVVIADLREDSPTKGTIETIETGERNMHVILIPPHVWHGYKAIGDKPMGIIYHAGEAYNPENPGIEVMPHDSPKINYQW